MEYGCWTVFGAVAEFCGAVFETGSLVAAEPHLVEINETRITAFPRTLKVRVRAAVCVARQGGYRYGAADAQAVELDHHARIDLKMEEFTSQFST